MKRAVVTGGAGFIGSHVVDQVLERGAEVLVIDNLVTGRRSNLDRAHSVAGGRLTLLETSICDADAYNAVISFKPDVILHLAAQMDVRHSVQEPAFDAQENVVGTVNMLEAGKTAGVKRFVFSSTGGAIYGEQDHFPADENHPVRPKSPYGVSKRAAELYLSYYAQEFGLQTFSLRFANVYGPRQNPHGEAGVVAIFANRLLDGEALRVNGDGGQTRDFVYVGDVVRACMLATDAVSDGGFVVYNVGRGVESSVNDIVETLRVAWEDAVPDSERAPFRVEHGPALAGEQRRSVIDAAKIDRELGWRPEVDLQEGLAQTIRSFCSRCE